MYNQLDYIFFFYGVSFIILGTVAWMVRDDNRHVMLPWRWLAGFGFTHGLNEWLDMLANSLGDSLWFSVCRYAILLISFIFLLEFGRRCYTTRWLGKWIYLPLLLAAFSGGFVGLNGVNVSIRYSFGTTGCLLTGLGLLRYSLVSSRKGWLGFCGTMFLFYGIFSGVIVPRADIFPAMYLNQTIFWYWSGLPVQLIRAFLALAIMVSVWMECRPDDVSLDGRFKRIQHCLLPVVMLVFIAMGWLLTDWKGKTTERNLRQELLVQAREVASGIDWGRFDNIPWQNQGLVDWNNPVLKQMCSQLADYARVINCSRIFVWSPLYAQGIIVDSAHGAGNKSGANSGLREWDDRCVEEVNVSGNEKCFLTPVAHDDMLNKVDALALSPISVTELNKQKFVIGLEKDVTSWRRVIALSRMQIIFCTMWLTLLVMFGIYVLFRRETFTPHLQKRFSYLETYLCFLVGISLTCILTFFINQNERYRRLQDFSRFSTLHGHRVQLRMHQIQDIELLPIAMFYTSSENVTIDEFHNFAAPLLKNYLAHRICAAKIVHREELPQFIEAMKREGLTDFRVFEFDSSGRKVPVGEREEYMPLVRNEPFAEAITAMGFDLLSNPKRATAIRDMIETGLPSGTGAVFTSSDRVKVFVAYAPLFKQDKDSGKKHLQWVVMLVLRPEVVLREIFSRSDNNMKTDIGLYVVNNYHELELLGSWPDEKRLDWGDRSTLQATFPIFILGRTYLVKVFGDDGFFADSPRGVGWFIPGMCMAITVLLTLLIWFLNNRRLTLQRLVESRTQELINIQSRRSSELEELVAQRTRELQAGEQLLKATFRSIGDGVIQVDGHGRVIGINIVAEFLTGWKNNEAVGQPVTTVFNIINAKSRKPVENPINKVLAGGNIATIPPDTILVDREGKERRIADSVAPILGPEDKLLGAVLVFRDITTQHSLEEKLRQSQKMEAVGQLAGGVAHDFNNMLTGIMGATQLLPRKISVPEEFNKLINIIIDSTSRAAGLTRKLLDFSRKGKVESAAVDIHNIINATIGILERSIDPKIRIIPQLDAEKSIVNGDPSQLQNAILNLALNSRDAMPAGGELHIRTRNVHLHLADSMLFGENLIPGIYIEIVVRDTGIGMSSEILKHIFEPFFTTKEIGKGTGLGLAAVYGMIMDHKGSIQVYSEPGNGAAFKIYLPVDNNKVCDNQSPMAGVISQAPGHYKILLVDDEQTIREAGTAILEDIGYQVQTASNGVQAIDTLMTGGSLPDVIILDMVMPEMNGQEAYTKIRNIAPEIPIIFSSGFTSDKITNDLLSDPFVFGFVQKPYMIAGLAAAVEKALAGNKSLGLKNDDGCRE